MKRILLLLLGIVITSILSTYSLSFPQPARAALSCNIAVQTQVTYGDVAKIDVVIQNGNVPQNMKLTVGTKEYTYTAGTGKNTAKADTTFTVDTKELQTDNFSNSQYVVKANGVAITGDPFSCTAPNNLVVIANTAQPTTTATPPPQASGDTTPSVEYDPSDLTTINGYTDSVTLIFHGLDTGSTYSICLVTNQDKCTTGGHFQLTKTLDNDTFTLKVCGNGTTSLKADENCKPGRDYFHEGYAYNVGVYGTDFQSGAVAQASFYVYHAYPTVTLDGLNQDLNALISDTKSDAFKKAVHIKNPIQVTITQKLKIGGARNNNFQVELDASNNDTSVSKCVNVSPSGKATQTLSNDILISPNGQTSGFAPLPAGNYTISISEGVHDSGNECSGGFVYYQIPVAVSTDANGIPQATIVPANILKDPNNAEVDPLARKEGIPPPCVSDAYDKTTGNCGKVATALGVFSTDPSQFFGSLMGFILSLCGFIIFLQFIYAGYGIITSRGDKEKLTASRERITSAIIGFIFIVISLILLQIIGVDILRLPGFGR